MGLVCDVVVLASSHYERPPPTYVGGSLLCIWCYDLFDHFFLRLSSNSLTIFSILSSWSSVKPSLVSSQRLSINTHKEYRELYKVDPRLPSAPDERYRSDWMSWSHFLRNELPLYTFKEARKVIAELGLKRASEYMLEKERNPRLPSNPRKYFHVLV